VDLTHVILGPYCTQHLADLGAEVIKVESPEGDIMRGVGPSRTRGMGPVFLHLNRNKRSVVLDLKKPAAREALYRLCADADVFAVNMRADALQRMGVGYEALAQVNSRLVYASMLGFSQRGPYAEEAAFDDLIQAAVALPHIIAQSTGDKPRYVPTAIADRSVGLYAMGMILAALYHRERTGRGQKVDIPMFETMAQYVLGDHMYGRTYVPPTGDFGYQRLMGAERRPYATKDGHLCILLYTDKQWQEFFARFGKAGLPLNDPRFKSLSTRTDHINEIYAMVATEIAQHNTAEIKRRLDGADITFFPVHTFASLMEDPHLRAVGFFREEEHPTEGRVVTMGIPSEWSESVPGIRRPAPKLGQHTREVLREAGLADEAIDALVASGAASELKPKE
jgi:crotonobetainyl-CoA:carnitine CoA-transferase CaiB-like acyl-CoA transferase